MIRAPEGTFTLPADGTICRIEMNLATVDTIQRRENVSTGGIGSVAFLPDRNIRFLQENVNITRKVLGKHGQNHQRHH
jgi:hypothetical protein